MMMMMMMLTDFSAGQEPGRAAQGTPRAQAGERGPAEDRGAPAEADCGLVRAASSRRQSTVHIPSRPRAQNTKHPAIVNSTYYNPLASALEEALRKASWKQRAGLGLGKI